MLWVVVVWSTNFHFLAAGKCSPESRLVPGIMEWMSALPSKRVALNTAAVPITCSL